ncbi:trafficking protein Mon1-domain-containing protein [Dichomitus squalens]|uniref:Vacuolar fusion protein MON1 n=1 Tax=Dichomitus squalens TaxID=114155 RepID=A0A4Q9MIG5_9APHY|nr:trafficking protein Mon1-domain-containing protein [Dichomitus squalens]TBU44460.1 trafficking protein Mon1-domain-containing protein [Dichomitus squalens]
MPSLSNLRVYSHGSSTSAIHTPPTTGSPPGQTQPENSSSASSVVEGVIFQEPDVEVDLIDGEQGSAAGMVESRAGNEESKRNLRDQLRRTLSKKESSTDISAFRRRYSGKAGSMQEIAHTPAEQYLPRQYFVLTDAGKPVFVSDQDANSDSVTSMLGVAQALVSIFLDDGDKLRTINAGNMRIVFLLRPPLYYVCVSSWGEPESVTRFHLEYLHLQILSVFSAEQLRRMFEQRRNFDLGRLLRGAEPLLYSLLSRLEWDLAMGTSSLHCLKLDPALRKCVADILVPTSKIKDILYVIMIAQGRVITLVRPRKHSIHPSDLHILINTIHSPSILNNSATASYLPVCLPKFNPSAFVNAYVMFLPRSDLQDAAKKPTSEADSESVRSNPDEQPANETASSNSSPSSSSTGRVPEIALVAVSGSADFELVRGWADNTIHRLSHDSLLKNLNDAISQGSTEYSVSNLSIPGLRHFIYKSRSHVQITMPLFEDPYDSPNEKRRLVTLYQTLYDAIHAKSGQEHTLKLQYIKTSQESVMGWITQPFELYIALSPRLPKSAAVNAANAIARWVQKEEKQLFLRDAPVF